MIDKTTNNLFINGENLLSSDEYNIQKIRHILKNYLELDNVNFLFGAGSSIILGARSIKTIPIKLEEAIKANEEAYIEFIAIIQQLQNKEVVERIDTSKEINYPLEDLLNYLLAIDFLNSHAPKSVNYKNTGFIIKTLKKELFQLCDIESHGINADLEEETKNLIIKNKYYFHEQFTKKLLQRSLNLKRANIFTTNYDLAFDNAFDRLGVNYISGFSGFHKRVFKPETFEYDIFFPGSTTQGKVQRIEKVLRYFKIHGSLTWVYREPSSHCVYGIEELPIELIRKGDYYENIMIYPTTAKKTYTLDYPYSELLRQLSTSIAQPQSVLITFGYSFCDEHINDLIYQALTIPSFTLIIVDFNGTKNPEIKRIFELKDPRIIILEGSQLGSFPFFVKNVMPDLIEIDTNAKIAEVMQKIYPNKGENIILPQEENVDISPRATILPIISDEPPF